MMSFLGDTVSIQAVIFDRDGVLIDIDWLKANNFFTPLLSVDMKYLIDYLFKFGAEKGFPLGLKEEKTFWDEYWSSLCDNLGHGSQVRHQLQQVDYLQFLYVYPEVKTLLAALKCCGFKVAVLSNFPLASFTRALEKVGLSGFIDQAFSSSMLGVAKPDPTAYIKTAEQLKVKLSQCLFIDDHVENVLAAKKLRMRSYLIDRNIQNNNLKKGRICDLNAVYNILKVAHE